MHINIDTNVRRTRAAGDFVRLHSPSYRIVGVLTLQALQARKIVLSKAVGGQRYFEIFEPHSLNKEDGVLNIEATYITGFKVRSDNEARD